MGSSAADDSMEETAIIVDDEVSNTASEYSDKVSTQPSENEFKKPNGSLFPSKDVEKMGTDLVVNEVSTQSTEKGDEVLVQETILIDDDVKEINCNDRELHLESKSWGCNTDEQLNPLDLSSQVKYFNTNAFNELNCVLLVSDNASTSKSSEDDDVVFVTTYTATTTTTITTTLASSNANCLTTSSSVSSPSPPKVRRKRKKKVAVVPRRNPKRIAQMEKASVDLAMKLSIPKRIFGCRTKSSTEVTRNCRQSCRTTGAILSPPRALRSKDWKDWPSEGLHEKPFYNPDTKCIQHFDKNIKFVSKVEDDNKSDPASRKKVIEKIQLDDSLATVTHQSLHSILGYLADVKLYNRIREKIKKQYLGDFCNLFSTVTDNNVPDACGILLDTCKLYCLCNGISQEDLVQYINSISVSDLEETNFEECSSK